MRFGLIMLVLTALAPSLLAQSKVKGVVAGVVFEDQDGDGRRGPGEPAVPGVVVCTRSGCAATDEDGAYEVPVAPGTQVLWARQPDSFRARAGFWRRVPADPFEWLVNIPLERGEALTQFSFLHASDTHLDADSLPRFRRLREVATEQDVAFVLLTGDLIRDALRVPEQTARERFELLRAEIKAFPMPVWVVPGNHENFGIERHLSGVSENHPLYGKAMYRHFMGPTYYSFDYGGVHFMGLDTADIADQWYYGHVDADQLRWIESDLSNVPAETPIVTFNHIPFFSAIVTAWGYHPDTDAPGSLIEIDGKPQYRHVVSNFAEVLGKFEGRRHTLALGGHLHAREELVLGDARHATRFHQTAAVVGPSGDSYGMRLVSGVTLYRVRQRVIDSGEFIPLDPPPAASSY